MPAWPTILSRISARARHHRWRSWYGAIAEEGGARQICTAPRSDYTRMLLDASPVPDQAVQAERRAQRLRAAALVAFVERTGNTGITSFEDLRARILRRELTFPPQVEKLAAVSLADPELLAFQSSAAIAVRTGVSKATISRFARLLGKQNLKEARRIFQCELRQRTMQK